MGKPLISGPEDATEVDWSKCQRLLEDKFPAVNCRKRYTTLTQQVPLRMFRTYDEILDWLHAAYPLDGATASASSGTYVSMESGAFCNCGGHLHRESTQGVVNAISHNYLIAGLNGISCP